MLLAYFSIRFLKMNRSVTLCQRALHALALAPAVE